MMPTFPRSPLSFRTAGFPQYGWKAGFQVVPSRMIGSLSLLPACAVRCLVCIRPSCTSWSQRVSRTVSGRGPDHAPPGGHYSSAPEALAQVRVIVSRSVITCRPHPPHSQAHRDFTAWRLIRDAFAVRERRGDPRVVPSFRCTFLPDMPSSPTPGSSVIALSNITMTTRSSPHPNRLDTPDYPAIRFPRGSNFGASLVRICYGLSGCSPPWSDQTGISPGHRRLLLPGFRWVGRPSRRWI